MADTLATPSDLASLLQQDVDTATATLALEMSTSAVQAAAGQRILQVVNDTVTLDLDPETSSSLYLELPEGPVTAVGTVLIGTLPVTDFTVQLSRGRLWRAYGWLSATRPYWPMPSTATVTYTHGIPSGDQRLQLGRAVVLELAKTAYGAAGGTGAIVREQIDDYAVQYAEMSTAIEAALDPAGAMAAMLRRTYGRRGRGSVPMLARRFC